MSADKTVPMPELQRGDDLALIEGGLEFLHEP